MIKIKSTDALYQYDEDGRAITTWDAKKCSWIINAEFENEEIDWWGKDNDFPRASKLANFIEQNPNWDKIPDIQVTWTWNTENTCITAFGSPSSFGARYDYWRKMKYPYTHSSHWGYIEYTEEEAIESLGKYCDFHKHADNTRVLYNNKEIFNGKLK